MTAPAFSLVRGGPFHALMRAAGLARGDGRDPVRRALVLGALGWVPLAALETAGRVTTHHWDVLMRDPSVHVRLLVAVPLLCAAEEILHARSVRCVDRFVVADFVPDGLPAILAVLSRATRLRDSFVEILLAIAAWASGVAALAGVVPESALLHGAAAAAAPSIARVWWLTVAVPVSNFLFLRALWRWAIWSWVMGSFARLDVRPVALHPDRRGGLEFLGEPCVAFALVVMSLTSVLTGSWGARIVFEGAPIKAFGPVLASIAALSMAVTFAPTCLFTPCMQRARHQAVRDYSELALAYSRLFHAKWIDLHETRDLLGTADIQSMADLANVIDRVFGMMVVPFTRRQVFIVLVAALLPVVPLVLATVPHEELWRHARELVLGGLPGK